MVQKDLVSVLIPTNKEKFLTQTINDVLQNATGNIEIVVALDGYWPHELAAEWNQSIVNDPRVHYIHFPERKGMRAGINAAAAIAQGEYLLKLDGHCRVAQGFDEALKADFEDNWVVIPRRLRLDAIKWEITDTQKPPVDYEYLNYPRANPKEIGLHGNIWPERTMQRLEDPKYLIDDNMSFQGSCWFMSANYFHTFLGGLSEVGYETFVQEAQEIGLKTWLGGGRVVTNKKTWYAHLHKGSKLGRGYFIDKQEMIRGRDYSVDYWMNNKWEKRVHDMSWLIEKFSPVPTWPEDRSLWKL